MPEEGAAVVVDGVDGIGDVRGVEGIVDVEVELDVLSLVVRSVVGGVTGVGSVVVVATPPFRTLLIVFNRGYFPCWQTPRKSSVSIDQIMTPPSCSSTTYFALSSTLSMSS